MLPVKGSEPRGPAARVAISKMPGSSESKQLLLMRRQRPRLLHTSMLGCHLPDHRGARLGSGRIADSEGTRVDLCVASTLGCFSRWGGASRPSMRRPPPVKYEIRCSCFFFAVVPSYCQVVKPATTKPAIPSSQDRVAIGAGSRQGRAQRPKGASE